MGTFSSASLFGAWLAKPMEHRERLTGQVMGVRRGDAVERCRHEVVPEKSFEHSIRIGVGFVLGALTYYNGDRLVDERGGADRQAIDGGVAQGLMPEAFEHGGKTVGLVTVLGYFVAAVLAVAQ